MKIIIAVFIGIVIIGMFVFKTGQAGYNNQTVKIGFCPTMTKYVQKLNDKKYKTEMFSSASEVLLALNNQKIEVGIIGRRATLDEKMNQLEELMVLNGYTLVGKKGSIVSESDLSNITIHTSVSPEISSHLFPPKTHIVYYSSSQEAIVQGIADVVLISWKNYIDDYQLIVPMRNGYKIAHFRSPHIYNYPATSDIAEEIKNEIKKTTL